MSVEVLNILKIHSELAFVELSPSSLPKKVEPIPFISCNEVPVYCLVKISRSVSLLNAHEINVFLLFH